MQFQSFLCQQPDSAFGGRLTVMPLATIAVYSDIGTDTVLADIYDQAGDPLTNPATADASGQISFRAANGIYDIVITSQDASYTTTLSEVAFLDPADSISVPGVFVDKGAWNASTNSPSLADGVGTNGWVYRVTVAGSTSLDGISNWKAGDKAFFNGTTWERIVGSNLDALYLALSGGTLTGALTLAADPSSVLHASSKQYADKVTSRHTDVSGGATLGSTDLYQINHVDASGGAATIILDDGEDDDWIAVRKKDSGSNRVTVQNSDGDDLAWLSVQQDVAFFVWRDSAWTAVWWKIAPVQIVFTASGTFTKPPLASRVEIFAIGAGGGGAAGRRGAAGTGRFGGQGGQGGSLARLDIRAIKLSSTTAVTVGAGGAGASGAGADSSDGNSGAAGGASSFGSLLVAPGGALGAPGSTAQAVAVVQPSSLGTPAPGPTATSLTVSASPQNSAVPGSGGNGGGISSGDAAADGAAGAASSVASSTINGGASGGAPGGVGSNGSAIGDSELQYGGSGGGGGAGSTVGAAGNGGNGGAPGGGGGGGGASVNGNMSGAGGSGGRGEVRVTTYF